MAWGTGKLLAMATASGLEYKARTTTSDVVTVPTTAYPPIATAGAGSQWHMGVKFCYNGKALSVAVPGDSTRSGTGSTADYYSGVDVAAKLARADGKIIIESAKWAIPSQTNAGLVRNVRSIISASVRPDAILIPTWSTNDGILTGAFALGMVTALMLARECEDAGITPILLTPPPSVAITAGAVTTLWVNHRNAVLALANDYHVLDCYRDLIDPALPGRFLSALSADGYHPNDAGYAVEGAATYAFLLERF
jgi:lysophospholipase L1-like esterase